MESMRKQRRIINKKRNQPLLITKEKKEKKKIIVTEYSEMMTMIVKDNFGKLCGHVVALWIWVWRRFVDDDNNNSNFHPTTREMDPL